MKAERSRAKIVVECAGSLGMDVQMVEQGSEIRVKIEGSRIEFLLLILALKRLGIKGEEISERML